MSSIPCILGLHTTDTDVSIPVALGTQFSILDGLQPNWLHDGAPESGSPFFAVDNQNLIVSSGVRRNQSTFPVFGGWIQLSFHSDFTELLNVFLDIWKFKDESYKSGAFAKQPNFSEDDAAQKIIANLLGIPQQYTTMPNKSFVLARYWKTVEKRDIQDSLSDTSAILEQELSEIENANDTIRLLTKYGTHFLSGYTLGDCIYQVFTYDKNVYDDIIQQYPQTEPYLFGYNGIQFRLFIRPRYMVPHTNLTFGYSEHVGKVLALSKDPNFETFRPYLSDHLYSVEESIFNFVTNFTLSLMTDQMTRAIPVELQFNAISSHAITDLTLQHQWNETIMVSTFQKFGKESHPNFQNVSIQTFSTYMQAFNPDLVTGTATSYTAIVRMNFNLQDLKILNPGFVSDLFIFADVIEIDSEAVIRLPGQNSIYIICRKFISHSYSDKVPELIVSSESFEIVANNFVGVLRIVQEKHMKHFSIINGTMFRTVQDSRFTQHLTVSADDIPKLPTPLTLSVLYNTATSNYRELWLTRTFVSALELEIVSIQNILSIRASMETVKEAESALLWIIDILSNDSIIQLSPELEAVLGNALLIDRTRQPEYLGSTLLVPRLAFSEYKELYEMMLSLVESYEGRLMQVSTEISERKRAERETYTQMELNENILSIGDFLVKQVTVATENQQDIVDYHNQIDTMKLQQIQLEDIEAQKLLMELQEQQQEVKNAGDALEAALNQYKTEQIVREIFEVTAAVGSLFAGGAGLAALPASAASIEKVVKKVEYVVEVIEQISSLYEQGRNIRNDIGTFNRATMFLDRGFQSSSDFPSELEWMDFDTDIDSYTRSNILPGQVSGEAADFQAAAKKLSARGRAYLNLEKKVQTLKYEVIVNELQKGVVERQVTRLSELQNSLSQTSLTDYETNVTDLFEVGNILMMRANEVRTKLAQTFITMDAALQYQYLQDPTPLEDYNTLTLQSAALKQVLNSVNALEDPRFRPHNLPNPISYNIPGVRVSSLLSDEGFKQRIPLSTTEFLDYVRVRIIEIEMEVDGVEMSPDDTVFIEAETSGEMVKDRDLSREERHFASYPVTYRYVYNFKTGETQVGNRPAPEFIDKFMMMTPFAEWTYRIPNVTLNRDIKFADDITTLRLKFYLSIVLEPSASIQVDAPSLELLLGQMDGSHILRDWDAVCAMDAAKTNELWKQKFEFESNNGGFVRNIETPFELTSTVRTSPIMTFKTYSSLRAVVGPPKLSFIQHNSNSAQMVMNVESANVSKRLYLCTDIAGVSSCMNTYNYTESPNAAGASIVATLELAKIVGIVDTNLNEIALDFRNGAFNHDIQGLTSDDTIAVRNGLYKFFNESFNSEAYVLGTVNFQSLNTPAALQPDKFYLSTGGFNGSPDGLGTLYIFIKTKATGSLADETATRDFSSPVSKDNHVIPPGYTSALFISSRVIFQDVVQPQFATQLPNFSTIAKPSGTGTLDTWILSGTSDGTISFRFDSPSNWDFIVPVSGFKMKSSRDGLKIDWGSEFESNVRYIGTDCPILLIIFCSGNRVEKEQMLKFRITAQGTSTPTVDSTSAVITFPPMDISATLEYISDTSEIGDIFSGDLTRTKFAGTVSTTVTNELSSLSLDVGQVSVFALTNLIFPGARVLDLREVYLPGDMLILGNVTRTYNPEYQP